MSDSIALMTEGLHKSYGRVVALRGVDLEVRQGEIFGFLGPNGAGKPTPIRCLLDLIRPDSGTLRVLGMDPQADPVGVRARTGYLPGELNLDANLRVREVLRYFSQLRGAKMDWSQVPRLAQRLDLDLETPVKNLSKGNKQKVGVVQALMPQADLLLLDEPTSGLDPLMQQQVHRMLREACAGGATVFFSSHIISEVEALAEHVAIIRDGRIVEVAEPGRLVAMTLRRLHIRFQQPVDVAPLARIEGVSLVGAADRNGMHVTVQVEGEVDRLIKALAAFPVRDLETEHPSLEEVFLAYYQTGKAAGQEDH
jgi:ABC-2 type transport system ATP-binding protein